MNQSPHSIKVSITAAAHRDRLLADAETTLLHNALPHGNAGILITRLTLTDYELTLSAQVPFGQTHIRDHWTRPAEV